MEREYNFKYESNEFPSVAKPDICRRFNVSIIMQIESQSDYHSDVEVTCTETGEVFELERFSASEQKEIKQRIAERETRMLEDWCSDLIDEAYERGREEGW